MYVFCNPCMFFAIRVYFLQSVYVFLICVCFLSVYIYFIIDVCLFYNCVIFLFNDCCMVFYSLTVVHHVNMLGNICPLTYKIK